MPTGRKKPVNDSVFKILLKYFVTKILKAILKTTITTHGAVVTLPPHHLKRSIRKTMEKGRLIRNMECASCEHVFDCKGKPEHIVSGCVNYEKRNKSAIKAQNDTEKGEVKKDERH